MKDNDDARAALVYARERDDIDACGRIACMESAHLAGQRHTLTEILPVLEKIEWNTDDRGDFCPSCLSDRKLRGGLHIPDCALAALIAKARKGAK